VPPRASVTGVTSLAQDLSGESGYFMNARGDVVAELVRPLGRVLDVGCGAGNVGPGLRAAGAEHLTGVEFVPSAADAARARFDHVLTGAIEDVLPQLEGPFDTILCLDVLEHLVDPAAVLAGLRGLAAPGGHLKVSVPNARQISLVYDLVVRGTFGYTDWGHRDRTHLRWFTRRDIVEAVAAAGWRVDGVSHPPLGRSRMLDRLTRGRSTEFLVGQLYVAATAA
jgi:2-polyprenyl-3-methyl-5-hydroxy-6-metoxy-1,4-benzoquinol methylase